MVQLEKTSTQAFKACTRCRAVLPIAAFHLRGKQRRHTHCNECRNVYQRRYRKTHSGWASMRRYDHSVLGRARSRKFLGAGAKKRFYRNHPNYIKELYHRRQDEFGCHNEVEDFYPAYRMIKALQEAETVEIRV